MVKYSKVPLTRIKLIFNIEGATTVVTWSLETGTGSEINELLLLLLSSSSSLLGIESSFSPIRLSVLVSLLCDCAMLVYLEVHVFVMVL